MNFFSRKLTAPFLLLLLSGARAALAGSTMAWTVQPSMPAPRGSAGAAVVNGKIYVIGGGVSTPAPGGSPLQTVEAYDPATGQWTSLTPMPTARYALGVAAVGGTIYAIGGNGSTYFSIVEAYYPASNTWATRAAMPTPRTNLALAVAGGYIYAIGGTPDGSTASTVVERYDPVANSWLGRASLLTGRVNLGAATVNGEVYAIGGNSSGPTPGMPQCEKYTPGSNSWTALAGMPTARSHLGVVESGGVIYALGGSSLGSQNVVEVFDPASGAWTDVGQLSAARSDFGAVSLSGLIWVVGGTVMVPGSTAVSGTMEAGRPVDVSAVPANHFEIRNNIIQIKQRSVATIIIKGGSTSGSTKSLMVVTASGRVVAEIAFTIGAGGTGTATFDGMVNGTPLRTGMYWVLGNRGTKVLDRKPLMIINE